MEGAELDRRLVSGTAINAVGALVVQGLELVTVAIAIHRVGVAAFGVVVLGLSVVQWPMLLESGVGQEVVRVYARPRRADGAAMAATAFWIYVGLAAVTVAFGLFVSHLGLITIFTIPRGLNDASRRTFDLLAVTAGLQMLSSFVTRALVGETRLIGMRVIDLIRAGILICLVLALTTHRPSSITEIGVAYVAAQSVSLVLGLALVRHRAAVPLHPMQASRECAFEHWRVSRPLLVNNTISLLWTRLDPLIVNLALGASATTAYGLAFKAYDFVRGGMELLVLGLMPTTARLIVDAPNRVGRLYSRALGYVALVIWPLAVVGAFLADEIIRLWAGRPIAGAVPALVTAMVLVAVQLPAATAFYVVVGAGKVRDVLRIQVLGVTVNLLLSATLVFVVGVSAVFVGTIAATAIITPVYLSVTARLTDTHVAALVGRLPRAAVGAAAVAVVLGGARLADISGGVLLGVTALVGAVYLVAVVTVLIPRDELRGLIPSRR